VLDLELIQPSLFPPCADSGAIDRLVAAVTTAHRRPRIVDLAESPGDHEVASGGAPVTAGPTPGRGRSEFTRRSPPVDIGGIRPLRAPP